MEWNLFIIPLTIIFTELTKQLKLESKWLPWIAISIGALLGVIYSLVMQDTPDTIMQRVVEGIVYGASASGIYDAGRTLGDVEEWS